MRTAFPPRWTDALCVAIGLSIPMLSGVAPAAAYRTAADDVAFESDARIRWSDPHVDVWLSRHHPIGTHFSDVETALTGALAAWNDVDCASLDVRYAGATDVDARQGDGRATVAFVDTAADWRFLGFSPDMAATTDLLYAQGELGWRIVDADVHANGGDFIWGVGESDDRDLQAVLTHELGHVAGLYHPCEIDGSQPACTTLDRESVMDPIYHGVSQRIPTTDDIAGACFLYPVVAACESGACGGGLAGDPCATGDACTTGLCSESGDCVEACGPDCPSDRCATTGPAPHCLALGGVLGDACTAGADCESRICLARGAAGMCTRPCEEGCPEGFECSVVSDTAVCMAPPSSGCAIAAHRSSSDGRGVVVIAVLALIVRRRRRAARRTTPSGPEFIEAMPLEVETART